MSVPDIQGYAGELSVCCVAIYGYSFDPWLLAKVMGMDGVRALKMDGYEWKVMVRGSIYWRKWLDGSLAIEYGCRVGTDFLIHDSAGPDASSLAILTLQPRPAKQWRVQAIMILFATLGNPVSRQTGRITSLRVL